MVKFPTGAIKTPEEFRDLMKSNPDGKFYLVHAWSLEGFKFSEVDRFRITADKCSFNTQMMSWWTRRNDFYFPVDSDEDCFFAFTNYWYAYAYSIRFKKK